MNMDRTDLIIERLTEHVHNDLGSAVAVVSLADWAEAAGEWAAFGWAPPEIHEIEGDDLFVVPFQPTVLAALAADLDDDTFDTWIMAVEFMVDMHMALFFEVTDPDERRRRVEDAVYEECGGEILRLLSNVQFEAGS